MRRRAVGSLYEWEQSPEDVTLFVNVPAGIKARDVTCTIHAQSIRVSCGEQPALVEGALEGAVDVDGSSWTMEGGIIEVSLEKRRAGAKWSVAIVGHGDLVQGRITSAADAEAFSALEQEFAALEQKMCDLDGTVAPPPPPSAGGADAAPAPALAPVADAPPPSSSILGVGRLCPRRSSDAMLATPDASLTLLPS